MKKAQSRAKESRKHSAPGYDEKQPSKQFPVNTKAPVPKKPKK